MPKIIFTKVFLLSSVAIILIASFLLTTIFSKNGMPFIGMETKKLPWSIGIYVGSSPLSLHPSKDINNPVLSYKDILDVNAEFVADPFMFQRKDKWYMFFEVMNTTTGHGDIGLATSPNGVNWTYKKIVLDEPFHLSFPYIFESEGDIYMLPESADANAIRIYKADVFPTRWTYIEDLVEGRYADSTILHHDNIWWLFTTNPHPNSDSVYLFHADNLLGPWLEHPMNPVVEYKARGARSAGKIIEFENRIIRFVQDIYPTYGKSARAYEIVNLSKSHYEEKPIGNDTIVTATGNGWNARGMHHIDAHKIGDKSWIAVVDGIGRSKNIVFGIDK